MIFFFFLRRRRSSAAETDEAINYSIRKPFGGRRVNLLLVSGAAVVTRYLCTISYDLGEVINLLRPRTWMWDRDRDESGAPTEEHATRAGAHNRLWWTWRAYPAAPRVSTDRCAFITSSQTRTRVQRYFSGGPYPGRPTFT